MESVRRGALEIMERLSISFWQGRKVLITGNTGFKGSWLALWLHSLGAEVIGYSIDIPTNPSLFKILRLPVKTVWGDVCDYRKILQTIKKYQPEMVFHLAAQPLVRLSYQKPVETFAANTLGTAKVLETIRRDSSVKAAVMITTDKVYLNPEGNAAFVETDPLGGHDPYSASKAAAEIVINAYRSSFFYKKSSPLIASVRAGNVIGGGDFARDRLIPDCLRSLEKRQKIVIRNPQAIRPWQHVLEPLHGYLLLGQKLLTGKRDFAEAWNFGPRHEDAKSVEWIVRKMCKLWVNSQGYTLDRAAHPHEAQYLRLDSQKAQQRLGWKQIWNIEQALQKIIDWHQVYIYDTKKLKEISLKQIKEYQDLIK
jgi:CDP-glucose 4,6-dehydratase